MKVSILKILFFWLFLVLVPAAFSVETQNCKIEEQEKVKLLEMNYQIFDQTMGEGWRIYADRRCFVQTALLLDEYREINQSKLENWQTRIISWHAGQMYAFDNDYFRAKNRFLDSLNPSEDPASKILWNDYVNASIAFLDKDVEKLKFFREKIANGPSLDGKKMNLNIVDNFINCFNWPYSIAYSGCKIIFT